MKSLLLSCKNFESKVNKLATRPKTVKPEGIIKDGYTAQKSIVTLITVEEGDDVKMSAKKLAEEIRKFSEDTDIKTIVVFPFAHLSNKLATSEESLNFLDLLESELDGLDIIRVHFGSHKSLLLDVHDHVGNVRFREF